MSVYDEIENIKTQKLAADYPETFTATVMSVRKDVKKGEYAGNSKCRRKEWARPIYPLSSLVAGCPILKLELAMEDNTTFTTSYRIPKAWTGKGQLEKLIEQLKSMGLGLKEIEGKTFKWKRIALSGSVKGHPRHYPIQQVKQTNLKK